MVDCCGQLDALGVVLGVDALFCLYAGIGVLYQCLELCLILGTLSLHLMLQISQLLVELGVGITTQLVGLLKLGFEVLHLLQRVAGSSLHGQTVTFRLCQQVCLATGVSRPVCSCERLFPSVPSCHRKAGVPVCAADQSQSCAGQSGGGWR